MEDSYSDLDHSDRTPSPFHLLESDYDPIVIAAQRHARQTAEDSRSKLPAGMKTSLSSQSRDPALEDNRLNIVALGRTGDGKSSLLNDMLGKDAFKHKRSSQTADIQECEGFWSPINPHTPGKAKFGVNIKAIDTPGFGDSELRDGQFLPMIRQKIIDIASRDGIHCILMVFKVSTSKETILMGLHNLNAMLKPSSTFWRNVVLVFTHADASTVHLYRSNKITLKTKIGPEIKEMFDLDQDLPMVFISTQKHLCSYLKGLGDCDCVHGSRYHTDCRRRFYEQVWSRRHNPFLLSAEEILELDDCQPSDS
ncbi:hypothetical protein BX666DRAFT_2029935 [Dichotomocladium elegans]|nr:hypothetical protein BX666DRAFT_2029935 [Dichotomocladium elegans]